MTNTTLTQPNTADAVAGELFQHLEQAWNQADGSAFGAVFAEESDFVEIRGGHHRGVAAIAHGHQAIFDSIYAGSTLRYVVDIAREVGPGTILAVATSTLDAPTGPLQGVNNSRVTAVIVQDGDRWVITGFHNTLVVAGG